MNKEIGKVIKEVRESKGIKQIFIAEKAGISNRYLSAIESGTKKPTSETIKKIAEALGVTEFYIYLEFVGQNAPENDEKTKELKTIVELFKESALA